MSYGKYFMIVSEDSGLVLDVKGASTDTGTDVIMYEQSGNDNQIWYEHPTTGTIRSKLSDLCLDFDSESMQRHFMIRELCNFAYLQL